MKATPLFLFTLVFLFTACHKQDCAHGFVTDAKTGKPVANVTIKLGYEYNERGSLKFQEATVYSDDAGEFSYAAEQDGHIHFRDIYKAGYSQTVDLERGGGNCEEDVIKLMPLDGILKLTVTNTTGSSDSLFARVLNRYEYDPHSYYLGSDPTNPYPLVLPAVQTFSQAFGVVVADSSYVLWKFTENGPWVNFDSLLIKTADTTFFDIHY